VEKRDKECILVAPLERTKEPALSLGHWPWVLAAYSWFSIATDS